MTTTHLYFLQGENISSCLTDHPVHLGELALPDLLVNAEGGECSVDAGVLPLIPLHLHLVRHSSLQR